MSQYDHECPYCGEEHFDIENRVCYACGRAGSNLAGVLPFLLMVLLITTVFAYLVERGMI